MHVYAASGIQITDSDLLCIGRGSNLFFADSHWSDLEVRLWKFSAFVATVTVWINCYVVHRVPSHMKV